MHCQIGCVSNNVVIIYGIQIVQVLRRFSQFIYVSLSHLRKTRTWDKAPTHLQKLQSLTKRQTGKFFRLMASHAYIPCASVNYEGNCGLTQVY